MKDRETVEGCLYVYDKSLKYIWDDDEKERVEKRIRKSKGITDTYVDVIEVIDDFRSFDFR